MDRLHRLTRGLAAAVAALAVAALAVSLAGPGAKTPGGAPPVSNASGPLTPLFAKTEPAANKPVLVLQPDDRGVSGWVAGAADLAGKDITVKLGKASSKVTVGPGNTFRWDHRAERPQAAAFTLADPKLAASVRLAPPTEPGQPSVFFVTDRSAYRPGHTLKFAAFVRRLTADGEFEPVRDTPVVVGLVSEKKQTRAARLPLRTDSFGRVTGEYPFSDADALDHYTLSAAGFTGTARVMLGEYRKGKVGLKIAGEVTGGKLILTFDTRDYLGRSVKGSEATYTAVVSRTTDPAKLTLNPGAFVSPEAAPPSADDLATLPDDERLLSLANGVSAMTFAGFGNQFVSSREGKVEFQGDGPGKVELDLPADWLKGHHTAAVTGVMLDETGRENRSTATIDLTPARARGVKVTTPRELVASGDQLPVSVEPFGLTPADKPTTTLVVVRLDPNPGSPWVTPDFMADTGDPDFVPDNTVLPPLTPAKSGPKPAADGWKSVPVFDPVKRKVLTVLPVADGKADATLKAPGAYKLLAVTRLADGTVLQAETGVVVKAPAKLPGVVLALNEREVQAGSRLRGVAHTRFAGAKMLLTLRDSTGVRLTAPLTADAKGVARIDEPLPANLRYGCAVSVQYPESPTVVHADQRELFVVPTDRTITVATKVPATPDAGAEVKLDISVNRQEPVDLVVSVYDEALLGVAGDLSQNVRDFYLADARGQNRASRELVARRLGDVTVAELLARAEALLKDQDRLSRDPGLQQQLQSMLERSKGGQVAPQDLATLVRLAGFEVYLAHSFNFGTPDDWAAARGIRLADVLRADRPGGRFSAAMLGNVVMLGWWGRDAENGLVGDPWAMHRGFGQFGFGGYGAFGHFGNLGGQFGIAGMPMYWNGRVNMNQAGWGFGALGGGGFAQHFGVGGGVTGFGGGGIGQFGFSHGFNRDFALSGNSAFSAVGGQGAFSFPAGGPVLPALGPAPGLNVGTDLIRRDFADSAFWSANLRTDAAGRATAAFKVPDSLTNWRVVVTAISAKMHVGSGVAKFKTSRPVMVWPMLPRAFAEGDTVAVFGTVHNLGDKDQDIRAHLKAENGAVVSAAEQTVRVPAGGNVPVYWTYRAGKPGMTDLLMTVTCPGGSDGSLKRLPVVARGVEERATASGLVGKGDLKFTLPEGYDPATARVQVIVAPSLVADMADTLPYLVEYPYGCVEQTMSRFLPALRVAGILQKTGGSTNGELEKKLPKVVDQGVKRLIELQQPDGGWGWQGTGGTHEMMTPYALLGLLEAARHGYDIPNADAVTRGHFRLGEYVGQMAPAWDAVMKPGVKTGAPATQINDSLYCLAVLTHPAAPREHPVVRLQEWWPRLEKAAGHDLVSDYGHALAIQIAVRGKKKDIAVKLADALRKRAKTTDDRVYWTTAKFSRWADNTFEVTAACLQALVAADPNDPLIPGVLAYFQSTKRGDRWDSTRDTAAVLYALCDYLAAVKAGASANGAVAVSVNGGAEDRVKLDGPASKTVTLNPAALKPGENRVRVVPAEDAAGALARVVVTFRRGGADVPARDHGVRVERTVSVRKPDGTWTDLRSGAEIPKGSHVRVRVTATTTNDKTLQYTLVESPKPACGETIPADDRRFAKDVTADGYVLREDRETMTAFHYEFAHGQVTADYVFLAEFAGTFRLPPARAEQMYRPAHGGHSDSFVLTVGVKAP